MLLDLTGAQDCSEAHSAEVEKAALGSAVSLQPSNSLSEKIEDFSLDCFLKHLLYQQQGKDSRGKQVGDPSASSEEQSANHSLHQTWLAQS